MTGGVALNQGMVRALERNIGFKIHTSEYCQLNGAIGAALFAYQKCLQAENRNDKGIVHEEMNNILSVFIRK